MKLYLTICSFLMLNCLFGNAQDSLSINIIPNKKALDIRLPIIKTIGGHLNANLLFKTPKHQAFIISIAIAFDQLGKIDTVYFSKDMSSCILETIKPDRGLVKKIKELRLISKEYSSKIIVFPILFRRQDDQKIDNLTDFLNSFENLWPSFNALEKRPIILLKPFINSYREVH
ncbi:hypothetical protein H9X96_03315 [Pedobacter sp. N36a]|uniref:hypothetical protein n=1 Tax=Pedobacter sp. N36a TaxID=2767996 RepID=UPI00165706FA|nr:hypothetical protein [Pedobacter sp. N36a]MBC8984799.1 hypothetical protein [Pedobacter sp. N36a]